MVFIIIMCIFILIALMLCLMDNGVDLSKFTNHKKYRIREHRYSDSETIEYYPEVLGKYSREWKAVEREYSELFERFFDKSYPSLMEAKKAIMHHIHEEAKENELQHKFKGYEKFHDY